jgi:hypothetical protein
MKFFMKIGLTKKCHEISKFSIKMYLNFHASMLQQSKHDAETRPGLGKRKVFNFFPFFFLFIFFITFFF